MPITVTNTQITTYYKNYNTYYITRWTAWPSLWQTHRLQHITGHTTLITSPGEHHAHHCDKHTDYNILHDIQQLLHHQVNTMPITVTNTQITTYYKIYNTYYVAKWTPCPSLWQTHWWQHITRYTTLIISLSEHHAHHYDKHTDYNILQDIQHLLHHQVNIMPITVTNTQITTYYKTYNIYYTTRWTACHHCDKHTDYNILQDIQHLLHHQVNIMPITVTNTQITTYYRTYNTYYITRWTSCPSLWQTHRLQHITRHTTFNTPPGEQHAITVTNTQITTYYKTYNIYYTTRWTACHHCDKHTDYNILHDIQHLLHHQVNSMPSLWQTHRLQHITGHTTLITSPGEQHAHHCDKHITRLHDIEHLLLASKQITLTSVGFLLAGLIDGGQQRHMRDGGPTLNQHLCQRLMFDGLTLLIHPRPNNICLQVSSIKYPATEVDKVVCGRSSPTDTRRWINVDLTLVQRPGRWTNVKPTLIQCLPGQVIKPAGNFAINSSFQWMKTQTGDSVVQGLKCNSFLYLAGI